MVLEELAEVALVAVLAYHVERVAVGDAHAHHADQVRVIETGQDSRLLDEVGSKSVQENMNRALLRRGGIQATFGDVAALRFCVS